MEQKNRSLASNLSHFDDFLQTKEQDRVRLVGKDGGEEITLEEIAEKNGMFLHQLVSLLTARLPRIYYKQG